MKLKLLVCALAVFSLASCSDSDVPEPSFNPDTIAPGVVPSMKLFDTTTKVWTDAYDAEVKANGEKELTIEVSTPDGITTDNFDFSECSSDSVSVILVNVLDKNNLPDHVAVEKVYRKVDGKVTDQYIEVTDLYYYPQTIKVKLVKGDNWNDVRSKVKIKTGLSPELGYTEMSSITVIN